MADPALDTRLLAVDRAQLAIRTWGDGPSTILALHAGVADSRVWQFCAPAWADAGHRVIAYDRRGFGSSTWDPVSHDHVDDLIAVMDDTNTQTAVLVGNSMGGRLAMDMALEHPDRVSALVLIAASPSGYPYGELWTESEAEQTLDQRLLSAEKTGDADQINRLEAHYWLDGTDQPEGRVGGAARDLFLDMNGRALSAPTTGQEQDRLPAWPRLAEIVHPTLVVAGAHDLPGQNACCRHVADRIPNARLTTAQGSAHLPMLDKPAALTETMLEFLADI